MVARGIATADYDRDGDLDVLFTTNGSTPVLLRNDLPPARWISLELHGHAPNRDAIGAVVTLYADSLVQRRMVRTGSSYLSQSAIQPLLFGLADRSMADSVVVRWPTTGDRSMLGPLEAGQRYAIAEEGTRP
jgi:hypothetical protein